MVAAVAVAVAQEMTPARAARVVLVATDIVSFMRGDP